MRWYDYIWVLPIALLIAIIATPFLWAETVASIIQGAEEANPD